MTAIGKRARLSSVVIARRALGLARNGRRRRSGCAGSFLKAAAPENLQFYIYHDEDAEAYLNGVLAAKRSGFNGQYEKLPIRDAALATLKPTGNTLAIRGQQNEVGQSIDVGLVTVEQVDGERTAQRP